MSQAIYLFLEAEFGAAEANFASQRELARKLYTSGQTMLDNRRLSTYQR